MKEEDEPHITGSSRIKDAETIHQAKLRLTKVLGPIVAKVWSTAPISIVFLDAYKYGDDLRITYERIMGCWTVFIYITIYPELTVEDVVLDLTSRLEALKKHLEIVIDVFHNP